MTENANRTPTLVEFIVANGAAAAFPLLLFFSGEPNFLLAGVASVLIVTPLMFRPMLACPGPRSRAAILLLFTFAYLLLLGTSLAWKLEVGANAAGSWSARLGAGLVIAIAGFGPALVTGFPLLLLANSLLSWPGAPPKGGPR